MSMKKRIITIVIGIEAVVIAAVVVFLFYINSDTVKINRQLELAQWYLLEGDYGQAIAAFGIVIDIDPKNVEAYIGIAEVYVAADDLENAVKTLEQGARRTDSGEILEMLMRTAEMEKRETAAQRAAEAAAFEAVNMAETTNAAQGTAEVKTGFAEVTEGIPALPNEASAQGAPVANAEEELKPSTVTVGLSEGRTEKEELGTGYVLRSYDSQENLTKLESYDENGNLKDYILYSYDSQGNLTKSDFYSEFGNLYQYWLFSYDSQGNETKSELYDASGNLKCYDFCSYDSQGNLTKSESYSGAGNLNYYQLRSYDSQGNLTKVECYDRFGNLERYYLLSYDSQGNETKVELYDAYGNLIETLHDFFK